MDSIKGDSSEVFLLEQDGFSSGIFGSWSGASSHRHEAVLSCNQMLEIYWLVQCDHLPLDQALQFRQLVIPSLTQNIMQRVSICTT